MKYRNLKMSFTIEHTKFTVLSISLEKMVTPIPRHSHSKNSYELHYVSFGYGKLIADEQSYDVVPGTFFVTGPGVFHEQISDPKDPMTEYGVYLQVSSSGTKEPLLKAFLEHKFWFGEAAPGMHELMKQIHSELEQRSIGYELILPALLQQLILLITRQYHRTELVQSDGAGAPTDQTPADQTYLTIEEAFLYNYRDLTLGQLADMVHLGIRQTERLLLKHYNKTFAQKKTEARMSAAGLLLQDRANTIASVATALGYSSPEHFTNAFLKFYHMTPTAYRKG
ncbi:MAG: AraC family transcriptional regulator [Acetatifactor sp.]|nr:AraC family transcriptional regulator [Acetatifactor sp.]